jgi:hypothetical protein
MFDIPTANTEEGDALIAKAQKVRRWGTTLWELQRFLNIIRNLTMQRMERSSGNVIVDQTAQEAVDIL